MSGVRMPVAPREWIGADEYPWPAAASLGEGDAIIACYCVVEAQSLLTRHQKPYLKLQLSDRHGPIEARVWEDAQRIEALALPGAFVGVRGRVEIFNGMRQIRVEKLDALRVEIDDLDMFMPRSPRDPIAMARELDELIYSVQDKPLRALLLRLLGAETPTGRAFRRAPAAKFNHHAYVGGLLEHTLSVTHLCAMMARHYGAEVDRDLLITGSLLHDIGKIDEIGLEAGFPYTGRGKLLGHILMGLDRVAQEGREVDDMEPARLDLVLHLVASHQGKYEWQSPREPRILEAVLLHHADDLDAKMQLALDLSRRVEGGWSEYSRNIGGEILRHRSAEEASALREAEREREAGSNGGPVAPRTEPKAGRRDPGSGEERPPRPPAPGREESAAPSFDLFEE
ncbi:MAG TPA: HD domain-containing protein [Longimicrobiales bacterium]|nr:HD domain-containing protein [Longimicrobiales bacterium]